LHNRFQQAGFSTLHGFMPVQLKEKISRDVIKQTKNALFGKPVKYHFKKSQFTSVFTTSRRHCNRR